MTTAIVDRFVIEEAAKKAERMVPVAAARLRALIILAQVCTGPVTICLDDFMLIARFIEQPEMKFGDE